MRRWERHASALLALTVLMGSLATSGLCFMERAAPSGDEHSCCRSGVSAASPPCCMMSASHEAPAKAAARFELAAPTMAAELSALAHTVEVGRVRWPVRVTAWPAGSPPTRAVLRI
jgi:hypothetical protein